MDSRDLQRLELESIKRTQTAEKAPEPHKTWLDYAFAHQHVGARPCWQCAAQKRAREEVAAKDATITKLRAALEMIANASPIEEPTRGDWSGNADDDYSAGLDRGAWGLSQIARKSLGGEE